jgi:DNA-binding NarL/FixJ family response regulator
METKMAVDQVILLVEDNPDEETLTLRADPRTRPLPVVVFSSSSEGQDVRRCSQLGANSYVVKPVAAQQYRESVSRMVQYWLNVNLDPYLRK